MVDFDKILRTESVFKKNGQETLSQAWVPNEDQKLLCRDDIVKSLITIHKPIIQSKGLFSTNTLITGAAGIGKTVTIKFFGRRFKKAILKNNINLVIEYYDCLQHHSKSSILRHISHKLNYGSGHGFSDHENIAQILRTLQDSNKYLLIILDEVHHLPADDILALLNASIGFGEQNSKFSIIMVTRKTDWYKVEDEKIDSRTQHKLDMNMYNEEEAYKILSYRRQLAFRPTIISDEVLELISDMVVDTKNMRVGINVMRACGNHADEQVLAEISSEMVLESRNTISSTFRTEVIDNLKLHEKISLLAVARILREKDEPFVMIDSCYDMYKMNCEEMEKSPHVITSFRKYVRKLRDLKAIAGEYMNPTKDKKGRQLKVKIIDISAKKLIEHLETQLELR